MNQSLCLETHAMKRRRFAFGSAIALISLTLTGGCTEGDSSGSSSPNGASKPKIALIMKSLANEFFKTMADGARAHQSSHSDDYDLVVNGIRDERDLARQGALVEEMAAAGVDAIIIAPADSKALVSVCKRASDKGIAVINIDNKMDAAILAQAGVKIPFVGPDNRAGARKVGEHVATKLAPGAKVAILEGIRTAFNGQQRRLGFEDAMREAKSRLSTRRARSGR
jgi:ribose transport system substrate-binding protein